MATRGCTDSDGERIYFECWGDTGDVVVLGHGLGGSHAVWYQQVAFLSRHYRVITWDQRGFGNSTRLTGDIGPVPAVGDLRTVLDHLDVARAHVIGQSMGGWSALGFAIGHPERVISLTLADTTAGIFTPQIRQTLTEYGAVITSSPPLDSMPLGYHPAIGTQLLEKDLAKAFLYTQLSSLTEPPTPEEIMPLLMATDNTQGARQVTARTLFVVGEHDPIFPPKLIQHAASIIPDTRVEVVENTGHSPYFERADRWNDIVAGFLREFAD